MTNVTHAVNYRIQELSLESVLLKVKGDLIKASNSNFSFYRQANEDSERLQDGHINYERVLMIYKLFYTFNTCVLGTY